ncbi:cupin domain-containing protein [Falsirhodobacter sp. 1013]|uniref:cupin domain-containing protein n=1 Tax=Falsirhodobacter sp. 1013 TaxID=3417566 RepID=UPI003EB81BDA
MVISRQAAEHYTWGENCDGWILVPGNDLLVIEERMPANTSEVRHYHATSRQFFYVLSGTLTMELDGSSHSVPARAGIEIPPNSPHQARNDTGSDVMFLVISTPTSRNDRIAAPTL